MPYKPPVAIYDACVLYPFHLRNLLVQCAVDRLVDARWSDGIGSHANTSQDVSAETRVLARLDPDPMTFFAFMTSNSEFP